jgi:sugar phosphate isomerase/epimerase
LLGSAALAPGLIRTAEAAADFNFRYVLSSAMYGDMTVDTVLGEVKKAGCESVDIWRKIHATQREQIEEMGDDAFQSLLKKHEVPLAVSTCYPLGPFKQDDELRWVKKNGGLMTVCGTGSMGEKNPQGAEAKKQVQAFFEKLKPHYELAGELGITMALENHGNSMLSHPDSIRHFIELNPSKHVGIAFAPHHLNDHIDEIPKLIREIGNEQLPFIYFQEYHPSSKETMPKEEELKQLPGFGSLDYVPIVAALREIKFSGLAEIFMHPTPRGLPVLPTAPEITAVINKSRAYIDECLAKS